MILKSQASTVQHTRYSVFAILLHWLMAFMIIGSFSFGLYMVELPFSPARIKQLNWHKWAGITILTIAAIRLLWRLTHKPPPLNLATPGWQLKTSHVTHGLMYALFFGIPLMGWAYSSAAGFPIVYFGVVPLPDFVSPDPELAKTLKLLHRYFAYSLAALVALHIAAAVKHHWIDKDGLILRMMPGKKKV
jgi:cytochrome b561